MPGSSKTIAALINQTIATIYTNGANLINAGDHQQLELDILASYPNKISENTLLGLFAYDTTRTYIQSQAVIYNDGHGDALWICTNATTTGVFNPLHWVKVTGSSMGGEKRLGLVNITTDPQIITFTSVMPSASYILSYRVFDNLTGATDGGSSAIMTRTNTGFIISSPMTGADVFLEYIVNEV